MFWRKLNHLVPDPKCRTVEGAISDWTDSRPQPSQSEIDAVLDSDIDSADLQKEEDDFSFPDVLKTIAKALHNHENRIRALEGKPTVTLRQVIKALRAL